MSMKQLRSQSAAFPALGGGSPAARVMRTLAAALVALLMLPPAAWAAPAGSSYKCKDVGHVRLEPYRGGVVLSTGHTSVQVISKAQCLDNSTYHGRVFLIVVGGQPGLHLLPALAHDLRLWLAIMRVNVSVQHTVSESFQTWKAFTASAARALASQLQAAGA
jgi:hypothetical protein